MLDAFLCPAFLSMFLGGGNWNNLCDGSTLGGLQKLINSVSVGGHCKHSFNIVFKPVLSSPAGISPKAAVQLSLGLLP